MPTRKTARRARGTGSIFHDARRGLWVARVPVGRLASGRTRYREVSAPTQADAIERLKHVAPPGPNTTVRQWSARWLAASTARPSTKAGYQFTLANYILPALGHVRVAALSHQHCEAAVRQWSAHVGPATTREYLGRLRTLINAARRAGLCRSNPAADVRTPKPPRRQIVPLTPADLGRIVAASRSDLDAFPVALLASTGCRVGEAMALDVADFDAAAGTVAITRTYSHKHGSRPPKSEYGVRTIRVPESARPVLVRSVGNRVSGPLFVAWDGRTRRYYESVARAFRGVLERLGLPKRNLHQLRHSVASALVAAGEPLADVAEYLGDTLEVVVATYVHPTKRDVSRAMDRLLHGNSVGANAKTARKRG